jgi:hypothetical protein
VKAEDKQEMIVAGKNVQQALEKKCGKVNLKRIPKGRGEKNKIAFDIHDDVL